MKSMFTNAALFMFVAATLSLSISTARSEVISGDSKERIILSDVQRQNAGIKVRSISSSLQQQIISIQGEVLSNQYETQLITPLTESIVLARHVTKSTQVSKGDPLATLFSAEVAKQQTLLLDTYVTWQRFKTLSNTSISEQEKQLAELNYRAAKSTLLGLGLNQTQITQIENNQAEAFGQYTLHAPSSGVVIKDEFILGQRIEPGVPLFTISNEQTLWVEAQLPWQYYQMLPPAMKTTIQVGDAQIDAQLQSQSHYVAADSRTTTLRFVVENKNERLHPGMFVSVAIPSNETMAFVIPNMALTRSADGDFLVYVERQANQFSPIEVEVIAQYQTGSEIRGLPEGANVVIDGVFFLASEANKNGFDAHGH